MRRLFVSLLIILCMGCFAFAAGNNDSMERNSGRYPQKFTGAEDDPVLQALAALKDAKLQAEIGEVLEIFYSSRFTEASKRIGAILEKYPESAIGGTLYNFLLLMNGTALGFSGEWERSIRVLDVLLGRLGDGADAETVDTAAGIMDLKIDILEGSGVFADALIAMDDLINRFGGSQAPMVQWRVERAMHRKAILLKTNGKPEDAAKAYRAYIERLKRKSPQDEATQKALRQAVSELSEIE